MFSMNLCRQHGEPLGAADRATFGPDAVREVVALMSLHPAHRATPVHSLPDFADALGVGLVWVKDESGRFGLGSFKALGGAYAVVRIALDRLAARLGRTVRPTELLDPGIRVLLRDLTVGCATDGNHGRSVAAGANLLGMRACIFVHEGVSPERVQAIAQYGAQMIVVPGHYDDAVACAARECDRNGWIVVSDTSWPGYEDIPRRVMQGYSTMVHELETQLPEAPTHVFLQAGVGGFAAAVVATMHLSRYADTKAVIVEPDRAACLFESNRAGECTTVEANGPTVMAMLECYRPSDVAWDILARRATAFMTVDDEQAIGAMRALAARGAEAGLVSGESGAAGAAGLIRACAGDDLRRALELDARSRVLLISTEGATAPALYSALMGDPPVRPGESATSRP